MPHFYRLASLLAASTLGLLTGACSASADPAQYRAYLADPAHGLTQTEKIGKVSVTCTYRPTDLLVAQEVEGVSSTISPPQLDSLRRSYAGKTYCVLSLSKDSAAIENQFATNATAFAQTLSYLNTGIAADVFLVTSPRDSVPALASMYTRQYGTTGRSTVLLIFDTHKLSLQEGFHLTFRGTTFGLGTLRFPFTTANLSAIPALKFY